MASNFIHSETSQPRFERPVPSRIAGREREVADIEAVVESARAGQLRVVLLSGEPGIGKTRLLSHAADVARAHDLLILRGSCYEDAEMMPYGPFVEILRDIVRQRSEELRSSLSRRRCICVSNPGARTGIRTIESPTVGRSRSPTSDNGCSTHTVGSWWMSVRGRRSCSSLMICIGPMNRVHDCYGI